MTGLIIATAVMLAVVASAGRWASVKNRRLQAEWSDGPAIEREGEHARNHR
jgi:hypothetical protein